MQFIAVPTNISVLIKAANEGEAAALLTVGQCVHWFPCDVQSSEGRALPLGGTPASKRRLQGWRPVANNP